MRELVCLSARDCVRDARFAGVCPVCGSRVLGRIGFAQYFCWDCCAQFSHAGTHIRAWEIAADGTLVPHGAALGPHEMKAEPVDGDAATRREEVIGR